MTQKLLKMALEALENGDVPTPENVGKNLDAITAIKEALAQPEQEPVATLFGSLPVYDTTTPQRTEQEPVALPCCGYADSSAIKWNPYSQVVQCHNCGQVYTTPPQLTFVGLTDEEIDSYFEDHGWSPSKDYYPVIKDIEAKLKEMNND